MRITWRIALCGSGLLACGILHAQTPPEPPTDTHRFETAPELPPVIDAPTKAETPPITSAPVLPPGVDASASSMAQEIGELIKQKQWQRLSVLVAEYESHPQADPFLVLYAKGALYRQEKRYPAAIAAFSSLLDAHPALSHIRLDLGLMQMEDKQYAEAIKTFGLLLDSPQTPAPIQRMAQTYRQRLHKVYTLDVRVSGNYNRNDNVNQASSRRILSIAGRDFVRAEDSMPKVGHGMNYGLRLQRLLPIRGRHGLSLGAHYYGVHYWDQSDYSERSLRLSPAWLYQTHNQWLRTGPVYERNWLGGPRYGTRLGAQAEWGRQLSTRQFLIPHLDYAHKQYVAAHLWRYQGDVYKTGVNWLYRPRSGVSLMLGASQQWDVLNDKTESSTTPALRAGGSYHAGNGFNLQTNLQAGWRDFDAPHFLLGLTRRDQEFMGSVSLWHSKVSLFGITPKLVYNYRRIRSNIPALYSRKGHGLMFEIVEMVF